MILVCLGAVISRKKCRTEPPFTAIFLSGKRGEGMPLSSGIFLGGCGFVTSSSLGFFAPLFVAAAAAETRRPPNSRKKVSAFLSILGKSFFFFFGLGKKMKLFLIRLLVHS